MKTCSKCGLPKPLSEFYGRSASKDGLMHACKSCQADQRRVYRAAHPEEVAEQVRERNRQYYAEHRVAILEQKKQEPLAIRQERRQRRSDRAREEMRVWRSRNPDRFRELNANHSRKRQALKLGAICPQHGNDSVDRRVVWDRDEGHCQIGLVCDGRLVPLGEMHLDHVIPLSRGGLHCYCNVQVACAPCNLAKGAA